MKRIDLNWIGWVVYAAILGWLALPKDPEPPLGYAKCTTDSECAELFGNGDPCVENCDDE